ncbi:unnamed protein product, partial [Candidula unifasciata]
CYVCRGFHKRSDCPRVVNSHANSAQAVNTAMSQKVTNVADGQVRIRPEIVYPALSA